jgi:hypothetical protein
MRYQFTNLKKNMNVNCIYGYSTLNVLPDPDVSSSQTTFKFSLQCSEVLVTIQWFEDLRIEFHWDNIFLSRADRP